MFSVLISVYNKEHPDLLKSALQSIWDNQSLKPSEIVIVKDGKLKSKLEDTLRHFAERAPVKFVVLKKHKGLGLALAEGIKQCSNEIIARMDADDISLPHRFSSQIDFLNKNPDISLLSSNILEFSDNPGNPQSSRKVPDSHSKIIKFAKSRSPVNHMAVMFKKSAVLDAGNYQKFDIYEDYYLWARMLNKGYRAANIKDNLVYARFNNNTLSRRHGLKCFLQELKLQRSFYSMSFISVTRFIKNIILRAFPRLLPIWGLKIIYNTIRIQK